MRRLPLACLATVAIADYVIHRHPPRWHAIALFDHPAHVATAVLLGGIDPVYLAGSLLPDVDHIPTALGDPQIGDPRPNTHSFLVLVAMAAASRRLGAGAATHFLRDLALAPGMPLLWPFTDRPLRVRYPVYAGVLIGATAWRSRRGSAER